MRSVHLIVTLGATLARSVPIQPRQFDDLFASSDIGGGNTFSFGGGESLDFSTESLGGDFSYTPTDNFANSGNSLGSGSLEISGFIDPPSNLNTEIALAEEPDLGAGGFSAETLDLANINLADVTFAPPDPAADVFAPASPEILSDVPTDSGLGVVDGDLIASADTSTDTRKDNGRRARQPPAGHRAIYPQPRD